ncbi:hypothetical protein KJ854_06065 [Patescibacteria group bacterium]|nr:hypothetical protein [Patescibacteria group bacterium]
MIDIIECLAGTILHEKIIMALGLVPQETIPLKIIIKVLEEEHFSKKEDGSWKNGGIKLFPRSIKVKTDWFLPNNKKEYKEILSVGVELYGDKEISRDDEKRWKKIEKKILEQTSLGKKFFELKEKGITTVNIAVPCEFY